MEELILSIFGDDIMFYVENSEFFTITLKKWSEVKWSEVSQLCPTLCDPVDCSLPGSSVMGFSRQEYWSELPFPSPGVFPDPGIEPGSPALEADALTSEPPGKPNNTITLLELINDFSKVQD